MSQGSQSPVHHQAANSQKQEDGSPSTIHIKPEHKDEDSMADTGFNNSGKIMQPTLT